jgi:hypothetical protein
VAEVRGSHARLTAATGWTPEIPLDQTLRDTLEWWRAELARGEDGSSPGAGASLPSDAMPE